MMDEPKVLYVDDEKVNLMLFEAYLGKKFTVLIAESGMTGLDMLLNTGNIQVVISDMKMPTMNGIEFIKKAREIAPKMEFYILTGFEITAEIQEALDTGLIKKYFRKPFNMNEISTEIYRAMKGDLS